MAQPYLSDSAIRHLRDVADEPDLSGTKYRLVSALERGGMGTVYVAEDAELGRQVALKVLSAPDPDGALAERMITEAHILARLEHPGIVPVHDVGRLPDGRVFYVMKQVRGHRLDEHAATLREIPEALRVIQRIGEAVAFAHAHGVVHRDLKPQNVMVGEFGEVLVLDWGVAKILGASGANDRALAATPNESDATLHGTRIGTPGYMAPEQLRGDVARIDARTDIYGLGAILEFLLAGRGWTVPRALRAISTRALAAAPEDRYQSVRELSEDINRFLDGRAVTAHRENPFEKVGRFVANYRMAVVLVLTYMVLRVVLLLFRA
jgi:serine/threonine protein kinase